MDEKIGLGKAHGKIILIGEHSVVYEKPAIAMPFPATTVSTIVQKSNEATIIDCDFYTGLIDTMPELLESLRQTIHTSLSILQKKDYPLNIKIRSDIPAERGMGSSAAVSVATTRAIFDFFSVDLSHERLMEIVQISEKIAHSNPSGLDALMTSSTQPYYYVKHTPLTPLKLTITGALVVADTGLTGRTKQAVNSISHALKSERADEYSNLIEQLGILTDIVKIALENNQLTLVGESMTEAHLILKKLGASCKELDTLVDVALQHQALGAKLTGGGLGGCMIALTQNTEHASVLAKTLEKAGAKQTWIYEMRNTQ